MIAALTRGELRILIESDGKQTLQQYLPENRDDWHMNTQSAAAAWRWQNVPVVVVPPEQVNADSAADNLVAKAAEFFQKHLTTNLVYTALGGLNGSRPWVATHLYHTAVPPLLRRMQYRDILPVVYAAEFRLIGEPIGDNES